MVRQLAERLRAAGLRVWLDDWIIRPGDLISAKIEEGLEHSAVLLLCMSANAFGSEWVSLEGHSAIFRDLQNLERRFVPLRLDDAPIKAMLRGYAYIDWRTGADREGGWARLLGACGVVRGEDPTRAASRAAAGSPPFLPAAGPAPEAPRPTPPQPRSLDLSHPGPFTSVAWSGDGGRVVSGGADGTVRLWEVESGRALAVLEGHKWRVWSAAATGPAPTATPPKATRRC
jgi:hypothetical protein